MCGLIGGQIATVDLSTLAHRGPDHQATLVCGPYLLGHTRLAVQDLTDDSNQPWDTGAVVVTYNGELWQPHKLRHALGGDWRTTGDTEVVATALHRYGTDALPMLHGMFALAWTDGHTLWLARDHYGEVPLHWGRTRTNQIVYASEIKALLAHGVYPHTIGWVEPGTYLSITGSDVVSHTWAEPLSERDHPDGDLAALLADGAVDRMTSDAPVACLVSGGLDSSAILALLVKNGYQPTCYTAFYNKRTADLKWSRIVCDHLGLPLIEVPIPEPTRATIGDAIAATEMVYKAQIEIALGCLPLADAMRRDGVKVVLSGEGSDELFGSYGWGWHGIQRSGWFGYRSEMFTRQHKKNFARTNKVFMAHGIEPRLPFLHDPLVRHILGMSRDQITQGGAHPKAVLATALDDLLPEGLGWRPKHAFQTGTKITKATANLIADPTRYYRAEHLRMFGKVPV